MSALARTWPPRPFGGFFEDIKPGDFAGPTIRKPSDGIGASKDGVNPPT